MAMMLNTTPTPGEVVLCNSESDYYDALERAGDSLVVVDCFAPWCPPCQEIAPVFEEMARRYPDVVHIKVDVDQVPELKSVLGVWALPTFCFLRKGQKTGSFIGANVRLLQRGLENNGEVSMCSGKCVVQ